MPRPVVLYVEDNENNIFLMQRIFQLRLDMDLLISTRGHDGLALARTAKPDLILLDRRLPDMLGNDFLTLLKASSDTAAITVIVVSGDSGMEHTNEVKLLGAAECLSKPFDLTVLLDLIHRYCPSGDY